MPSRKWVYGLFFLAGLAVVVAGGALQRVPAYMDAQYYYAGAVSLADGKGFNLPLAWNYLDEQTWLPGPSHTFWMPLTSILIAPGYALFHDFTGARALLWLLAALIPAATFHLGLRLHGRTALAAVGGLFALFPALYMAYMPMTDSFAVYMLLGYGFFLAADWPGERRELQPLVMGLLAGGMYLARSDGLFWLFGALAWIAWQTLRGQKGAGRWPQWAAATAACAAGFLIVASAWLARNYTAMGSLLPPGSSRALWLTRYEDLFVYPAALLTPDRWLGQGLGGILNGYVSAFSNNVQTAVAVQGAVALFPFVLIGLYRLRTRPAVRFFAGMWVLIFLVFTLVFPYQGVNGSFFHAGAAFQALFWAAAPWGIESAVAWVARLRKWQRGKQVQRFLEVLLVSVSLLLGLGTTLERLAGTDEAPSWNEGLAAYQEIDARIRDLDSVPCDRVMVNNPPAYYLASGRTAVAIPFGDEAMLLAAAEAYDVRYLVLEENNSGHLPGLYTQPGNYPGLSYLVTVGDARLYEFTH